MFLKKTEQRRVQMEISEKVYNSFINDRNKMKELLKFNSVENLLSVI